MRAELLILSLIRNLDSRSMREWNEKEVKEQRYWSTLAFGSRTVYG